MNELMSPADVPEELVQLAAKALRELAVSHAPGRAPVSWWANEARAALAAILPLVKQQLREQIASELYGLPIAQHLGIPRGSVPQSMVNVAEAAQRWMINVVLRPDLIPEQRVGSWRPHELGNKDG